MVLKLNDEGLYQCPVEGCQKAYKPRQSLVAHIKTKHQQKPKEKVNENMFDDNSQVEKDLAVAAEEQELIEDMQEALINFDDDDMSRYTVASPLVEEEDVVFDEAVALGATSMVLSLGGNSLEKMLGEAVSEVDKTTIEEENVGNVVDVLAICGECEYLFKTEAEAVEHMNVRHNDKEDEMNLVCGDCGDLFKTEAEALEHINVKHKKEMCRCDDKDETITKLGAKLKKMAAEKKEHVAEIKELKKQVGETRIIMEESIFQVDKLTSENESLKRLKETTEKQKKETSVKKRPASDPELVKKGTALLERSASYPVTCKRCDYTCVMVDNLFAHMQKEHKGQDQIIDVDEFGCDQCDESPASRSELMNHIVEKHSGQVTETVNKKVKCGKCTKKFTNENEMKKHKCAMHPLHSQWTCSFCNMVFKGVEARDNHICFKHPYQSVEVQRKRVYKNTTDCKWGSGCRHLARNTCWFRHAVVVKDTPQVVQVEEHQEGGPGEQEQGWQAPSRRRQGGRAETRYCSYQENCDRRDTCRYKHIESQTYLSSTFQENF